MVVLDCGCGEATIAMGLAESLPAGRVVGVDLETDNLAAARRYAASIGRANLAWAAADGRRLPFSTIVEILASAEDMKKAGVAPHQHR
jgi:ubiquinone/menaquinone biosynthesis C-methylase UbiE